MIVTVRVGIGLALLAVAAVIVQVSFVSFLHPFAVTPDLLPVVVVSIGLLGGAVLGAVFGFGVGLVFDSALMGMLGVSSLTLLVVGYLAGRYREGFELSSPATPALVAGALTLLASSGTAVVEVMLGVDAPVSLLFLREILLQGLYAMALAFLVFPLVRRLLRPALVDDGGQGGSRGLVRALAPGRGRGARRRSGRRRGAEPASVPTPGSRRAVERRPA